MKLRPYLPVLLAFLCLIYSGCRKIDTPQSTMSVGKRIAFTAASSPVIPTYDLPVRVDSGFIWGVNGHPVEQVAYWLTLPAQMSLLNELQAPYYRFDMNV